MTVRARQPGIATGLPLGRMHADTRAGTLPDRGHCPRCGCKRSAYSAEHEQHCAPCQRVILSEGQLTLPPFEPEWQSAAERARAAATELRTPSGRLTKPCRDCGTPLHDPYGDTGLCKACFGWTKRKPEYWCECGAPKSNRHDRYCGACAAKHRAEHCRNGHPWAGNEYTNPRSGKRECRTCRAEQRRRYKERRAA